MAGIAAKLAATAALGWAATAGISGSAAAGPGRAVDDAARAAASAQGLRAGEQRLVRYAGPVAIPSAGMPQLDPITFQIPRDGWLTGYEIDILDASGRVLPHTLLHHAELIDTGRRELFKRRYNRIASISHDTPSLVLPAPLGYPVRRGDRILVAAMMTNPLGRDVRASLRVTLRYRAAPNEDMASIATFNVSLPGFGPTETSFDVPAGRSTFDATVTLPVGGRLLAAGGHVHDYGRRLTLVLLDTGDTLYDWRAGQAAHADGEADAEAGDAGVMPVRRWGAGGLKLKSGQRLAITAVYDNPTGHDLPHGGMGIVGGVFLPDDWSLWPALDPRDPMIAADQRKLSGPVPTMAKMRM